MKTKHLYLILAVLGVVLPYAWFVPWLLEHGLNVGLLVEEIFASRISAFGWLDVIVSALALLVFIFTDRQERNVKLFWLPVLGTFAVGVSLGLPLYLYLREE